MQSEVSLHLHPLLGPASVDFVGLRSLPLKSLLEPGNVVIQHMVLRGTPSQPSAMYVSMACGNLHEALGTVSTSCIFSRTSSTRHTCEVNVLHSSVWCCQTYPLIQSKTTLGKAHDIDFHRKGSKEIKGIQAKFLPIEMEIQSNRHDSGSSATNDEGKRFFMF
jgi:hypothetical protein